MSDFITASFDTLLGQASDTASVYLGRAQREIDEEFGKGYAAKNPQMVAAFMQVASADMSAATHAKVYGAVLQDISLSPQLLIQLTAVVPNNSFKLNWIRQLA